MSEPIKYPMVIGVIRSMSRLSEVLGEDAVHLLGEASSAHTSYETSHLSKQQIVQLEELGFTIRKSYLGYEISW